MDERLDMTTSAEVKREAYIPGLGTVRPCVDCECLVSGGPTRCSRCAEEWTRARFPWWQRLWFWRAYWYVRLCAKMMRTPNNSLSGPSAAPADGYAGGVGSTTEVK